MNNDFIYLLVEKRFRDKYTGEIYEPGRVLTVTTERSKEILSALPEGYAAETEPPEVETEPELDKKPDKRNKKK